MTDNFKHSTSWADQSIAIWTTGGIKLNDGIPLDKIAKFENHLDYTFPKDFLHLYQKVNGFKEFDWNENMFSLWSLERILKEYQKGGDSNYIGFCDYLINSHTIGFSKSDNRIYKYYNKPQPIANTFQETITLLNSNADLLY